MPSLPEIYIQQIVGNSIIESVDLFPLAYEDGALPDREATQLLALLLYANPRAVLEIGTFFGATTVRMAHQLPNAIIHTVDLPFAGQFDQNPLLTDFHLINRRSVGREFLKRPNFTNIRQHFADTMTFDFQLAKNAEFFFIDGSHSYNYVKNDSDKCFELCNGSGFFVWHDAAPSHPSVLKLLEDWRYLLGRNIFRLSYTALAFLDARELLFTRK